MRKYDVKWSTDLREHFGNHFFDPRVEGVGNVHTLTTTSKVRHEQRPKITGIANQDTELAPTLPPAIAQRRRKGIITPGNPERVDDSQTPITETKRDRFGDFLPGVAHDVT